MTVAIVVEAMGLEPTILLTASHKVIPGESVLTPGLYPLLVRYCRRRRRLLDALRGELAFSTLSIASAASVRSVWSTCA